MKTATWLMALGAVLMVVLGMAYVVSEILTIKDPIAALSTRKIGSEPGPVDLPIELVGNVSEWRVRYPSSKRLQNDAQIAEHFAVEADTDQSQADDVRIVNELRTWKGATVLVHLKARDEMHYLKMPNLRLGKEVTPGKTERVYFRVVESNVAWDPKSGAWTHGGEWDFLCTEHWRKMTGPILVHETKAGFLKWLQSLEQVK